MFYEPLPGCITSNVRFSNSLERKTWVRYTHAATEPNRTKKKYSNWKKSHVQSECFKKNLWDRVRMFYFRTSSIEFGHRTKWNSLQKNTSGTKSTSWSSVDLKFCFFPTVEPVCNGPVLSVHPLLSGQFSSPEFSLIQTLYLLSVLGGHLY